MNCAGCGNPLAGRQRKYCSPPCAHEGHRLAQSRTRYRGKKFCQECGSLLASRQLKFCSLECRQKDERKRVLAGREDLKEILHCQNCGKDLIGRQRRWCSLACARNFETEETLINNVLQFTRKCRRCGIPKPLEQDYYKAPTGTFRRICKACSVDGNRIRDAKPDAALRKRDAALRLSYGIGVDEYEQMLRAQGGLCAVCKKPPLHKRLAVDHDHVSGKIRGLLCSYCNLRLVGKVRDSRLFHAAAEYLDDPPARRALGRDVVAPGRPKKKRKRRPRKKAA